MKNINYSSSEKLTPWRKVSLSTWKPKGDSSTYSLEDVIVDDLLIYCKEEKINIHSFFIKAISNTLKKYPKINSTIRFGKIFKREDISIFFHTIVDAKTDDLSGILIENGHHKKVRDIDSEFLEKTALAKKGNNNYVASKKIIGLLPSLFTKPVLNFYSFVVYTLNFNWSIFKAPRNAYGSIMLTSIGSLGLSKALCPIAPYTKVPMVISMGRIISRPMVVNNQIKICNVITLGFTFDHRIIDGIHFYEFFNSLQQYLIHPKNIENE